MASDQKDGREESDPRRALEQLSNDFADLLAFAQERADTDDPEQAKYLREMRERVERGAKELRDEQEGR